MSQTNPSPITALPAAPSTASPTTFAALADAFISALAAFGTQCNALASNVYSNAVDAYNNALAGASSAFSASVSAAAASASAAAAASVAASWVSGTTYVVGNLVWSPLTFQSYRRKTNGGGTVDPSIDKTNWVQLGSSFAIDAVNYQINGGL